MVKQELLLYHSVHIQSSYYTQSSQKVSFYPKTGPEFPKMPFLFQCNSIGVFNIFVAKLRTKKSKKILKTALEIHWYQNILDFDHFGEIQGLFCSKTYFL